MLKNGIYYIESAEDILYLQQHPEQPFFVNLMNDTAFRGTLSQEQVMRGFVSAVLKVRKEDIVGIYFNPTHLNPKYIGAKEGIMDVAADIRMPDGEIQKIDVELQVRSVDYWANRTLFYLCRMYSDSAKSGGDYSELCKCIHIGILNFDFFQNQEEYYSHIQLLNEKNQRLYSDQIEIYVIELNKLERVPEGERDSLYYWARLFQAASWEECAMIAEKEPDVGAAVAKMREFTEDERLREEYLLEEKIERDRRAALNTAFRRGKEEGEQEGKCQGEERVLKLNRKLMAEKRYDDLEKATEDEVYREKLYREFNLIK